MLQVLAAAGALAGQIIDQRLMAGLKVQVDAMAAPVVVDGVAMRVQRITGAGVPELIRRAESLWQQQGSTVKTLQQRDWSLSTRMNGQVSEVLQWRGRGQGAELLWSSLDTSVKPRPANSGPRLPAGCVWGRSVSGQAAVQSYAQRTARCRQSPHELAVQLRQSLPSQGWAVRIQ